MPDVIDISEDHRLAALERYDILDTPGEETFDRVTRLARRIYGTDMSAVTFVDGHRQWFKSRQGLDLAETARGPAMCDHVVRGGRALVVEDAREDERFASNPFVTGEPHLRFYAGVPLQSPDGATIGSLCVMGREPRGFDATDVAVLRDLGRIVMDELELRALATTDALTGALSRRGFRAEAQRAVALALRHKHPLSCLVLDLDHFKRVNDTFGHATGDTVLAGTAKITREVLRQSDIFGRIGGEEFAILLPLTGEGPALAVAEKLRLAFAARPHVFEGGTLVTTASFGIASLDRSITDVEELLVRADQALYAAKAAGRNRCLAWKRKEVPTPLRRRVLKAGRIAFNAGRSTIDCTIRSLSDTGAGMDVTSSAGVPDRFKLVIEADGTSRTCQILSKSERQLEVVFA